MQFLFALLLAAVVGLAIAAQSEPLLPRAWTFQTLAGRNGEPSQFEPFEQPLQLDFDALVHTFYPPQAGSRRLSATTSVAMLFELPLPLGEVECTLSQSPLFQPNLRDRLVNVVTQAGACKGEAGNTTVLLNFNRERSDSFSAAFTIPNSLDWYYVDFKTPVDQYVLYEKSKFAPTNEARNFSCGANHHAEERRILTEDNQAAPHFPHARELQSTTTSFVGITFRLALAANTEYCTLAGNTLSGVANRIATTMSRVNGIYMRELGVYFQLVADTDALFCLPDATQDCGTMLPNSDANAVINNAASFFSLRGITSSEYDVGHVFTTGNQGLAGVGVACGLYKARGMTGRSNPTGDAFDVDYVAHELGHQLNGYHSFRDCVAGGKHEQVEAAVEPGSGSTIMAYAGICGLNNLQVQSDAYFHPKNLVMMRSFVTARAAQVVNCGATKTLALGSARPQVTAFESTCTVPVGNYFLLQAQATAGVDSLPASSFYYQWDQVDTALDSFMDLTLPRFRSWKPRLGVTQRFFPNLYYLHNDLQDKDPYRRYERLPGTEDNLQFRFLARTLYSATASESSPNDALFGDFAYRDVTVAFNPSLAALKFTNATRVLLGGTLAAGTLVDFEWTPGSSSSTVELLIAINTLPNTVSPASSFDSAVHITDMDWVSLGVVSNTGAAKLKLPILGLGGVTEHDVHYMIKTAPEGSSVVACAAFDYVSRGKLQVPFIVPTTSPTFRPTSRAPTTLAPTKSLTLAPIFRSSATTSLAMGNGAMLACFVLFLLN